MRGLTCKLQMRAVDVLYAYKEVKNVISTFENMRKTLSKILKEFLSMQVSLVKILMVISLNLLHHGLTKGKCIVIIPFKELTTL